MMENSIQSVEVKMIDRMKYKETHGLFINGKLQYRGTEHECVFFQLKLEERNQHLKLPINEYEGKSN